MTREEAIIAIHNAYQYEMAENIIEALKGEPCDTLKLDGMLEDAYEHGYEQARHDFEVQPCEDAVSRQVVLNVLHVEGRPTKIFDYVIDVQRDIMALPSITPKQRWIPVSERLPDDLEPVNITWVNHEPEPYYHDIKDKNFVATGIYYRDQWYWYSTTCADYLGEYGSNEVDKVDDAVEIVAWMPLPEPYKEGESE